MGANSNKLSSYYKALGDLISKYRKEKGYTLEELGLRIGNDKSEMFKIEKGRNITVSTILKLALALDKTPKDFFEIDLELNNYQLGEIVGSKQSPKKKKKPAKRKTQKKKSK